MARYLVTGGCGFIGSHVVERLIGEGHQVRVLDNLSTGKVENITEDVELVIGDVTNADIVKSCMSDIDGCFHLAAIASVQRSNEDWVGTHQVNLTGTVNVFDAAAAKKTPVIYASSAAVYGSNIDTPLNEDSITRPVTAYGADKLGSELHARVAALVHRVPTVGFRFFNVYGPRQDPKSPYSGVISIFSERFRENEDICIFGDGEQTRDFVYVKDVVNFLCEGMSKTSLSPIVMNVCTGKATSINQLAKTLKHLSCSSSNIAYQPARKGDIYTSVGDPRLAVKRLGTSAQYSLYEGLRELIAYEQKERAKHAAA